MSIFKEIIHRLSAKTPAFFKTIQKISGALSAIGTAILTIPSCPTILVKIAPYLICSGLVGIFLAQLTKQDAPVETTVNPVTPPKQEPIQPPCDNGCKGCDSSIYEQQFMYE